jgi:hypothetical protein
MPCTQQVGRIGGAFSITVEVEFRPAVCRAQGTPMKCQQCCKRHSVGQMRNNSRLACFELYFSMPAAINHGSTAISELCSAEP